jgi:hypothetical protein
MEEINILAICAQIFWNTASSALPSAYSPLTGIVTVLRNPSS